MKGKRFFIFLFLLWGLFACSNSPVKNQTGENLYYSKSPVSTAQEISFLQSNPSVPKKGGVMMGDCHENKKGLEQYFSHKKKLVYWIMKGNCAYQNNQSLLAKLYFNRAMAVDPKDPAPYNNMGVLYLQNKRVQKALKAFDMALSFQSTAQTPLLNRSLLLLKYGNLRKGSNILAHLNKNNSNKVQLSLAQGLGELYDGDFKKALMYWEPIYKENLETVEGRTLALYYPLALYLNGDKTKGLTLWRQNSPLASYYLGTDLEALYENLQAIFRPSLGP